MNPSSDDAADYHMEISSGSLANTLGIYSFASTTRHSLQLRS